MYNNENDYELLYLISENNEDAKEIFFEKYRPIVEVKAKKLFPYIRNKGYELSDLIQEGMIGLSNSINDFREQKNVKFSTFANICIDRQLYSFIRDCSRQKHKILNDSMSIDSDYNKNGVPLVDAVYDEQNKNPEDSFIELSDKIELYENIKNMLSDREYEVFQLRMQGFTYQEIASLIGGTTKSIDGAISRIKQKLGNINKD